VGGGWGVATKPLAAAPPQMWDAEVGMCVRALEGHTFRVRALAAFPPPVLRRGAPARLISGSLDQTVIVWRAERPPAEWRLERRLGGHHGNILSVSAPRRPTARRRRRRRRDVACAGTSTG
jgi:hypothetical protein